LGFFNQWYDKTAISTLEGIVTSNFERLTYTEAVHILQASGESFEFPVEYMFKDVPKAGTRDDYIRYALDEMDTYGIERALIGEFEKDVELALQRLTPQTIEAALALLRVPSSIRGFGVIKERNYENAQPVRQQYRAILQTSGQ